MNDAEHGACLREQLGLLTEQDLAAMAGVEVPEVRRWRSEGRGPPWLSWGSATLYRRESLLAWLAEQEIDPSDDGHQSGFRSARRAMTKHAHRSWLPLIEDRAREGALSPEALAKRWNVPTATIRAMLNRGELPYGRLGRYLRIPLQAVEEWEGCREKTEAAAQAQRSR